VRISSDEHRWALCGVSGADGGRQRRRAGQGSTSCQQAAARWWCTLVVGWVAGWARPHAPRTGTCRSLRSLPRHPWHRRRPHRHCFRTRGLASQRGDSAAPPGWQPTAPPAAARHDPPPRRRRAPPSPRRCCRPWPALSRWRQPGLVGARGATRVQRAVTRCMHRHESVTVAASWPGQRERKQLTKLVWENMKTRCAASRQRLLSRLTTVERAWRPLVSDRLKCDIQYIV
jgi:hypothetical protein